MRLKEIKVDASFCAKKQMESLEAIFQIVLNQKDKFISYQDINSGMEVIGRIRIISNEIYSACEVINEMLIAIYRNDDRYRGTQLKNGFNSNFKEVYNATVKRNKELDGIYKDKFIFSFFNSVKSWFIEVHDIRTQETHYEVGKLVNVEGKFYYFNGNRNGVSKYLYSNPSNEIKIEIKEFISLMDEFLKIEDRIATLIADICKQKNTDVL